MERVWRYQDLEVTRSGCINVWMYQGLEGIKVWRVSRSGGIKVWRYQGLEVSRSGETMGLERQNYRKAKFSLLSQFKVL